MSFTDYSPICIFCMGRWDFVHTVDWGVQISNFSKSGPLGPADLWNILRILGNHLARSHRQFVHLMSSSNLRFDCELWKEVPWSSSLMVPESPTQPTWKWTSFASSTQRMPSKLPRSWILPKLEDISSRTFLTLIWTIRTYQNMILQPWNMWDQMGRRYFRPCFSVLQVAIIFPAELTCIWFCQEVPERFWNADRKSDLGRCCSEQPRCFWRKELASEVHSLQLDLKTRSFKQNVDILAIFKNPGIRCCFILWRLQSPGRNAWMEIVQKLVAVSLVSAVGSANGFQFSVAITLTMAATSAMVEPYAKPQVVCFTL